MATSTPSFDLFTGDNAAAYDDHHSANPKTTASASSGDGVNASDHVDISASNTLHKPSTEKGTPFPDQLLSGKINILPQDKLQEWTAVVQKQKEGPLQLLDLPVDVLKEITKEVTHTNDLTSLALTHSALHNLAVPHIYSRFDIVWPDAHATTDPRTGVDALTYGLATLAMGQDIFGDCSWNHEFDDKSVSQTFSCKVCGTKSSVETIKGQTTVNGFEKKRKRLGNNYPQFTRKFSLGNGPPDWVQEYMINKESGKMLGTLVALAVARMVNLETFIWDMPTGVLRDVWLALSSLENRRRKKGDHCKLDKVWVRWHDNAEPGHAPHSQGSIVVLESQVPAGSTVSAIGLIPPSSSSSTAPHLEPHHMSPTAYSQGRIESPTLSVLPPLKSLSVLDIDELAYVDEMSFFIQKSQHKLRELRVGISIKHHLQEWVLAWDGPYQQVDHDTEIPSVSNIGHRRLGGILGVLLGRIYDIRKRPKRRETTHLAGNASTAWKTAISPQEINNTVPIPAGQSSTNNVPSITEALAGDSGPADGGASTDDTEPDPSPVSTATSPQSLPIVSKTSADRPTEPKGTTMNKQSRDDEEASTVRPQMAGQLRLQVLELERVPLSITVLHRAFDWSVMTSLTILDCPQHESLWRMLRRQFQPRIPASSVLAASSKIREHVASTSKQITNIPPMEYRLNIKKIHTDAPSSALLSFLKETLAPNTLEVLFLQDRSRPHRNTITIDAIHRSVLKRHRSSLRKLLLDSSDQPPRGPNNAADNGRWRSWMPNREVLTFITSGKMSNLRELSIAADYKDWHYFITRLPNFPYLRSLNIPFIADHATSSYDPRELALQVVDIITLRPEVELCYMGISHKCFEILENKPHDDLVSLAEHHAATAHGGGPFVDEDDDDDDEGSGSDPEDEEDDEDDEDDTGAMNAIVDPDETESDISDHDTSDDDSLDGDSGDVKPAFRLREILHYEEKVAIFKARHGRL